MHVFLSNVFSEAIFQSSETVILVGIIQEGFHFGARAISGNSLKGADIFSIIGHDRLKQIDFDRGLFTVQVLPEISKAETDRRHCVRTEPGV